MSTEIKKEEEKKEEKIEVTRGLQIRNFDGKIAEEKTDGKVTKPEVKYTYDRIVMPWSRTGKDSSGKEVSGAVPSLSEVLAWANSSGFTTEFSLDKENNPEGPSVVGFLVDGINGYLNRTARVKAENTPDSAFEKSIQVFMKAMGLNRADAIKRIQEMAGLKIA